MMENHRVSTRKLLAALVACLPLTSAGCPYVRGNEGRDVSSHFVHPETALSARDDSSTSSFGQCSRKSKVAGGGTRSSDFWPCELRLDVLRQFSERADPLDPDFVYAKEFAKLDVDELKKDLTDLQTHSESWWPADFGNYGPFFIRLSWHNAGTYRQIDGRGGAGMGQQRFAPLNSWPDNQNLDKARRLLWPIKQKYGQKLSWADLFVFAGNMAMENMGFPTKGFAFGRPDTWQSDEGIYWGSETALFPSNSSNTGRYNGSFDIPERADKLEAPLANVDLGLIYVDPRGPNGIPNPKYSALDIRETFGRMGMDDEETVALIAGGHAFGKTHGAASGSHIGPDPNTADVDARGLGWLNDLSDKTKVITSGLEVIWSKTPTKWSNEFFKSLIGNKWYLVTSPGGAPQWEAKDAKADYPDPFIKGKFRKPTMLTSDLGLINDDSFKNISQTFHDNFDYFTEKFALAWYKLLHRDMGPVTRYLGPDVSKEHFIWQDPLPKANYSSISDSDLAQLKSDILGTSGLNVSNLVTTAWGAASSFRHSDKRGGANGGRIALKPQNGWASNNPARLQTVLSGLKKVQAKFSGAGKKVSLADLVVLGGAAAIEKAAKDAGYSVSVPFTPGRVDTTQDLTDVSTFAFLEPQADGFRNYGHGNSRAMTEELLVDKSSLLTLTPPEMTVLVGGMRALNANYDGSSTGILTSRPGKLTNDFFVNLASIGTTWSPISGTNNELFQGKDDAGKVQYTASRADLIFGSHPELRAITEVYGSMDGQDRFAKDFVKAWAKVMDLDRYDVFPSK